MIQVRLRFPVQSFQIYRLICVAGQGKLMKPTPWQKSKLVLGGAYRSVEEVPDEVR